MYVGLRVYMCMYMYVMLVMLLHIVLRLLSVYVSMRFGIHGVNGLNAVLGYIHIFIYQCVWHIHISIDAPCLWIHISTHPSRNFKSKIEYICAVQKFEFENRIYKLITEITNLVLTFEIWYDTIKAYFKKGCWKWNMETESDIVLHWPVWSQCLYGLNARPSPTWPIVKPRSQLKWCISTLSG